MTEQQIDDIHSLLVLARHEKAWPRQRKAIEEIEARYREPIRELHERRMIENGWQRENNGWSKAG